MWLVVLYFVAILKILFKLVENANYFLSIFPNINSHLGVKDSNLGITHPYTHIKLRHGL